MYYAFTQTRPLLNQPPPLSISLANREAALSRYAKASRFNKQNYRNVARLTRARERRLAVSKRHNKGRRLV